MTLPKKLPEGPVFVEHAVFYNGQFRAWVDVGTFPDKASAWAWLQRSGYRAQDLGGKFLVAPGLLADVVA